MPGGLPGGAWAVLELTDTLIQVKTIETARRDLVKGDRDRLMEVTA